MTTSKSSKPKTTAKAYGKSIRYRARRQTLIRSRKREFGQRLLTFAEIREIMRSVSGLSR